MAHNLDNPFPPDITSGGDRFEYEVSEFLRRSPKLPDGQYCYRPRVLLASEDSKRPTSLEVDFVVAGPNGVFLIEAKGWYGTVTGSFAGTWAVSSLPQGRSTPVKRPMPGTPGHTLRSKVLSFRHHVATLPDLSGAVRRYRDACGIVVFPEQRYTTIGIEPPNDYRLCSRNLGPDLIHTLTTWRPEWVRRPLRSAESQRLLLSLGASYPRTPNVVGTYNIVERGLKTGKAPNGLTYTINKLRHAQLGSLRRGKAYAIHQLGDRDRAEFVNQVERHAVVLDHLSSHPHIHRLFEFFDNLDSLGYWVIEEWVDGESLHDLLETGEAFHPDGPALLLGVAEALHALHSLRPQHVHRAVNPDSILIEETTGRAILTNFELTKVEGSMTVSIGAPPPDPYMAPEVLADPTRNATPQADVYSWGAVAYRLLTRTQFNSRRDIELGSLIGCGVPLAVAAVIGDCLNPFPSNRPRNGGELLKRLRGWR